MQEIICQAHMAGQMDAGCREPSWSNAHAYYSKNVVCSHSTDVQQLQAKITALVNNHCEIYGATLRSAAVSLLIDKLRQLSAMQ